ncbi:hypothetical protein [Streptomyces clavifer]|uniref:hypothetical protein n=1 Tax=Streptomyces clavifer TaxID=68188 RepID=UPI003093A6A9|nr:hypothetical protein OG388_29995 [Streptomyces clavifer]
MSKPIRRSVAAAALLLIAGTACGTERSGEARSAGPQPSVTPQTSFPPRPTCAQPPGGAPSEVPSAPAGSAGASAVPDADGTRRAENGDGAPHYEENHAYRTRAPLAEDRRARGEASALLIREELESVREEGDFSDARIAAALERLGCGKEHGVYIWSGFYSVHTGVTCVSGHVTKDELTSEVHGAYAEPQPGTGPCVENRGGH